MLLKTRLQIDMFHNELRLNMPRMFKNRQNNNSKSYMLPSLYKKVYCG